MTAIPSLRGTSSQNLYPFVKTIKFNTKVSVFANGSEQRFAGQPPLVSIEIPMEKLRQGDVNTWISFFNSTKGRGTPNLQDTIGGVAFNDLVLESDVLRQTNTESLLFKQQIKLRQVRNSTWSPPSPPVFYPTLSFGGVAEQPFDQDTEFLTDVNQNEFGPQYQYSYYSSGLSVYPNSPLKSWKISYGLLTDADIVLLENMFVSTQGRLYSFTFTDPLSGTSYQHVRMDQDQLSIRHLTVNQKSTEITLRQTYNS
jgi:hypothetical protein